VTEQNMHIQEQRYTAVNTNPLHTGTPAQSK